MKTIFLHNDWVFRQKQQGPWMPAEVPGCVHTDLMNNKMIEDPFFRENEAEVQWIGYKTWEYRTKFEIDDELLQHDAIDLIFEGLDTYADVYLNERLILTADNMFRTWRLYVKDELKKGKNTLRVIFDSPIERVLPEMEERHVLYPTINDAGEKTSPYTRKAPYHFGWDWGPRLVTCGMWKPVKLQVWDGARLDVVRVTQTELTEENARLSLDIDVISLSFLNADLTIRSAENAFAPVVRESSFRVGRNQLTIDIDIAHPQRWWPNGYGEQSLYTLIFELHGDYGIEDQCSETIGLRTLEVRQHKEKRGTRFEFVVNGVPLFAKGGNWIPADSFPSRMTPDRYLFLLESCQQANMNMLRVWGGGIYEADEFYALCDELGILVWQDFMFSCAMYPAEEDFLENVRLEVIDAIIRLRNHPCIALWCGNNEMEWGWTVWGWNDEYPERLWNEYETIFHNVIPNVCEIFDPTRLYWPSSPSSNFKVKDSNAERHGDMHYWGVWHFAEPFESYTQQHPRFMSEYGFQSFPLLSSIKRFAKAEDHDIASPVMLQHQKHARGNELIREYMLRDYPEPKDFESFLYLSQVLQAEGIKLGTEHFRRIRPHCMGALYWQINDCWPVASWSSIDYYGTWKALHYYAKRFYAPLLVSPVLTKKGVEVYVVSDLQEELNATLVVQLLSFDGKTHFESETPVTLESLSSKKALSLSMQKLGTIPDHSFLHCRLQHEHYTSNNVVLFQAPKELRFPKPQIKTECQSANGGFTVQLTSKKWARHVYMSLKSIEHRFDDNFFDLLPGESKTVFCAVSKKMTTDEFLKKLKVKSLYDAFKSGKRSKTE